MSRVARIVVPGYPHHVTQRGNRRADVFVDDDDRRFYLAKLRQYGLQHGLDIWSYCLMTNHVHFIAVPSTESALAATYHDLHSIYSLRFNQRHGFSGHVFQGRFYSSVLDEKHLWAGIRYVERNPVRAGMVHVAAAYRWSSAPARCAGKSDPILSDDFPPAGVIEDWAEWLRDEEDDATEALRMATRTGRPCGSLHFMKRLENLLGRPTVPQKGGRPRKHENQ